MLKGVGLLTEYDRLSTISKISHPLVRVEEISRVDYKKNSFPIYSIVIGSEDRTKPTLGLFGGVHGLERIGAESVLTYLESVREQLQWDEDFNELMKKVRLVSIPVVNPIGVYNGWRSNGRGVDLMRNAPIEAQTKPPWLLGGHTFSSFLPYYRGDQKQMEVESQALVNFVRQEMFEAKASLAIDFHSGFGLHDKLWYPYAKTTAPFPKLKEVLKIKDLLEKTHPHHVYNVEPQSLSYTTHGDLWDYLFDEHQVTHPNSIFIPWTLEMGSWNWIKKNPIQILKVRGVFDPIKPHRRKRILRRHILLCDFFLRAVRNYHVWT